MINKFNGACSRVINRLASDEASKTPPLLNNIFLVWADSTKNILNSEAAKDDLNKYYLDIIYANERITPGSIKNKKLSSFYGIGKKGFDIASCQFSIHYFFENKDKLAFYNHKVKWVKDIPKINKAEGKNISFDFKAQPLVIECKAFINWVKYGTEPPSNGLEGLRVLKVLEMAKQDLTKW